MNKCLIVTITGAAGQVARGLLTQIALGNVYGKDRWIVLKLMDLTKNLKILEAIRMELEDCCFPLLKKVVITDDLNIAFEGCNRAILIGAQRRSQGMKRSDLLTKNGEIFAKQGRALNKVAANDIRIIVIGNPSNTNCYITMKNAPRIPKERFSGLMYLDQNRARSILASKIRVNPKDIKGIIIWGNHSDSVYPDIEYAKTGQKEVHKYFDNIDWLQGEFIKYVRYRGSEIINKKGISSGFSASKAIIDHIKYFEFGHQNEPWISAAVIADGSYGVPEDLVFSFPIISYGEKGYVIKNDLELSDFSKIQITKSIKELCIEKEIVRHLWVI